MVVVEVGIILVTAVTTKSSRSYSNTITITSISC